MAMAALDFPLHGERRDASRRAPLWESPELLERSIRDLRLLVDAMTVDPALDGGRVGYIGFSMGVLIGVPFVARELRVRAAAFMVGGSPPPGAAPGTDPATFAGGIAPRPVMMVNADQDEIYPRSAVLALYDAFRPPKELVLFPGTHTGWSRPSRWYRVMREFLADNLGHD
jgi:dienelactone hydrolase